MNNKNECCTQSMGYVCDVSLYMPSFLAKALFSFNLDSLFDGISHNDYRNLRNDGSTENIDKHITSLDYTLDYEWGDNQIEYVYNGYDPSVDDIFILKDFILSDKDIETLKDNIICITNKAISTNKTLKRELRKIDKISFELTCFIRCEIGTQSFDLNKFEIKI